MVEYIMHGMNNLRAVDLNLLVVLDALLAEQNVSRAAIRLNMSQPAVSHALGRLRHVFDDPLLVRERNQLVPTLKAFAIISPLSEALAQIRVTLGAKGFDPSRSEHQFRLAMSDYGASLGLRRLINRIRNVAPNIDLTVSHLSREQAVGRVIDGQIDFALGVFPALPAPVDVAPIIQDGYACLIDGNNTNNNECLSVEEYIRRPHILVALDADSPSEIDETLIKKGLRRRVMAVVPHWNTAADLVRGSDLILTVARRSLDSIADDRDFLIVSPPLEFPAISFVGISHHRRCQDPAIGWLRGLVTDCFRGI